MSVTVAANDGLTICHIGSGGKAIATVPDICLTTVGNAAVPIPYPNMAETADLADGSETVTADGGNSIAIEGCTFSKSSGDEAGDQKGLSSGEIQGEAEFVSFSPDVTIEGKAVARLSDQMILNKGNTICMNGVSGQITTKGNKPKKNKKESKHNLYLQPFIYSLGLTDKKFEKFKYNKQFPKTGMMKEYNLTYVRTYLEEGWVYVYNITTEKTYEYKVTKSSKIQKLKWEKKDKRKKTEGQPSSYIVIPREAGHKFDIEIAYSRVQWTSNRYSTFLVSNNKKERSERMQKFTIGDSIKTDSSAHIFALEDMTGKYISQNPNNLSQCRVLLKKKMTKNCVAGFCCLFDPFGIGKFINDNVLTTLQEENSFINSPENGNGKGAMVSGLIDSLIKIDDKYDNNSFTRTSQRNKFKRELKYFVDTRIMFAESLDQWNVANRDLYDIYSKDYLEGTSKKHKNHKIWLETYCSIMSGLNVLHYNKKSKVVFLKEEIKEAGSSFWKTFDYALSLGKNSSDFIDHLVYKIPAFYQEITESKVMKDFIEMVNKRTNMKITISTENSIKVLKDFLKNHDIKSITEVTKGTRIEVIGSIKGFNFNILDRKLSHYKILGTITGIFAFYNITQILPTLRRDSWEFVNLTNQAGTIVEAGVNLASKRILTIASARMGTEKAIKSMKALSVKIGIITGFSDGFYNLHCAMKLEGTGDLDARNLYYLAAGSAFISGAGSLAGLIIWGGSNVWNPLGWGILFFTALAAILAVIASLVQNDGFENWLSFNYWGKKAYSSKYRFKEMPNLNISKWYRNPANWKIHDRIESNWFELLMNNFTVKIERQNHYQINSKLYGKEWRTPTISVSLPSSYNENLDEFGITNYDFHGKGDKLIEIKKFDLRTITKTITKKHNGKILKLKLIEYHYKILLDKRNTIGKEIAGKPMRVNFEYVKNMYLKNEIIIRKEFIDMGFSREKKETYLTGKK